MYLTREKTPTRRQERNQQRVANVDETSVHMEITTILNRNCLTRQKHSSRTGRANKIKQTSWNWWRTNWHAWIGQQNVRAKQSERRSLLSRIYYNCYLAYNRHVWVTADTSRNTILTATVSLTSVGLPRGEKLEDLYYSILPWSWDFVHESSRADTRRYSKHTGENDGFFKGKRAWFPRKKTSYLLYVTLKHWKWLTLVSVYWSEIKQYMTVIVGYPQI